MVENIKHIVRIGHVDLKGERPISQELQKVYGINKTLAYAVCKINGIPLNTKAGLLKDEQIKKIEEELSGKNFPSYLYNRRKDFDTGEDIHIIGPKLKLQLDFDKKRLQKTKSYRGLRLQAGLPVRGQRTRGNFRKGKALGVQRKKKK
tara:strand:- start:585 stop:1028 length:444 start_codon:yes stop_codon:yes gene_type:complete